jgi:hypothetical protein
MNRAFSRATMLAVAGALMVLMVGGILTGAASQADAQVIRHSTPGDLFYNYYSPPVGACGVGAEMYPCPRPAPALVGSTYITYQPLMPHEFLYQHHRTYRTVHDDGSVTRTSVRWSHPFEFKVPPKYSLLPCSWSHLSGGNWP